MATFNYAEMRDVAEELIAEFGQVGAIRRSTQSGPSYDPVVTDTDYACQLVEMKIDLSKVDGTLVLASDRMVYVSTQGLTIDVTVSDKLVIAEKEHVIKVCKPLSPAGLTVYYELIIAS